MAKVYIVSFRTHDDRRPSKLINLADSMKSAIKMAWEHGGQRFVKLGVLPQFFKPDFLLVALPLIIFLPLV